MTLLPPGQLRRLLVTGSRDWLSPFAVRERIGTLIEVHGRLELIHGAAPGRRGASGVDLPAAAEAKDRGCIVRAFPYPSEMGRRGGPIRNREMLDEKPDGVLAFWTGTPDSMGTLDCFTEAVRRGIPVEIHTPAL